VANCSKIELVPSLSISDNRSGIIIDIKFGEKMMQKKLDKSLILSQLKELKSDFETDGIHILGLFGSYARDEENEESDIDILIETTPLFLEKYRGLKAYAKLDDLKQTIEKSFNKNIDLVDKTGLLQHNNQFILDKTIYV
jgi:predicted nucleotidyltransferase